MDKKLLKQLRGIAATLPPVPSKGPAYIYRRRGSTLIASGITKDKGGKDIVPHLFYAWEAPRNISHFRRLKQAWQKNGLAGVDAYCRRVMGDKYRSPLQQTNH